MGHCLLAVKEMGGREEKLLHSFRVKNGIGCFWPGIKPNVGKRFSGEKRWGNQGALIICSAY